MQLYLESDGLLALFLAILLEKLYRKDTKWKKSEHSVSWKTADFADTYLQ